MDFMLLGNRIRDCRKSKGISLAVLAELTGVSVNFIGQIEHASRHIGLDLLEKIAVVLDTTIMRLLFEVNTSTLLSEEINQILLRCTDTELAVIRDMIITLKSSIRVNYKNL